jgi:hypothetical protein
LLSHPDPPPSSTKQEDQEALLDPPMIAKILIVISQVIQFIQGFLAMTNNRDLMSG